MKKLNQPILEQAVRQTEGPILELGTGLNSTPLLHDLGEELDRHVTSYESSEKHFNDICVYQSKWHDVILISNYSNAKICKRWNGVWGVAFVDHNPAIRRTIDIVRIKDNTIMIVCHDSEIESDYLYHYSEIFSLFKYRFDSVDHLTQTTVLSNFKKFRPFNAGN